MFEIITDLTSERTAIIRLLNNANDAPVTITGIFLSDGKKEEGREKRIPGTPISLKAGENRELDATSAVLEVLKPADRLEERLLRLRTDVQPEAFSASYEVITIIYRAEKILWFGIEKTIR